MEAALRFLFAAMSPKKVEDFPFQGPGRGDFNLFVEVDQLRD